MTKISPRGNPKSPVWIVCERPYEKDAAKGLVWSCPYGFVFDRAWRDAGISEQPFICSISDSPTNSTDLSVDYKVFLAALDYFKPPIICPVGKVVTALFCPETIQKRKGNKKHASEKDESSLEKWAGSLLKSPSIGYESYCIPQLPPDAVVANWEYRFTYVNIDLGRLREELDYLDKNSRLQSLPVRELITGPQYNDLIELLNEFKKAQYLSTDIETIRTVQKSELHGKHPGYPYTIALADSPTRSISFSFWDYTPDQTVTIWRELDWLLSNVPQIGQNYFSFDSHFLEALGFTICLDKCWDTMLIHQLLWPELPHKLQFLTKHYTRQPFYKEEGKGWSPKHKEKLMRYNALDSAITFEVFNGEQEELDDRTYLK